MLITNAFVKGTFRNIEIEDGKIIAVTPAKHVDGAVDVKGKRVIPGLIDVHTHGCVGMDTLDGNFAPMCDFLAKNGTTSWLPTTMTMDADTVERVTHLPTEFPGEIMNQVETYFQEEANKVITGKTSIDDWNKVVEHLKEMGIQEAIDIKNAAYERYQKR